MRVGGVDDPLQGQGGDEGDAQRYGKYSTDAELAKYVFSDYLPRALAAGEFVPTPEPQVVGHGLEHVQQAFDTQRKGVSAKKVVVTL